MAKVVVLVLLSFFVDLGQQCWPGKGYGRRRSPREHGPILYKQSVPSLAESSLGASGVSEGLIERDSSRFKELVVNDDTEIVFKDGIDNVKVMSQRCKERLSILANLVTKRWPGVRLRVVRSWDEAGHSNPRESLHRDGRAVDITTSDRDKEKLGTLGGLAVDAGFDWVYYETRSNIHCSVKSDSYITSKLGNCFSGTMLVRVENGSLVTMSSISTGDRVLTTDENGHPVFDQVIGFLHRNPHATALFVNLESENNRVITLTPEHLIFTRKGSTEIDTKYAGAIEIGDYIYEVSITNTSTLLPRRITRVWYTLGVGVYAPLTSKGTIVVEGYAVSCYGLVPSHDLAHAAVWPLRFFSSVFQYLVPDAWKSMDSFGSVESNDGIHWYPALLGHIFHRILPSDYWYST